MGPIRKTCDFSFDRGREFGHNDEKGFVGFQIFDGLVIVKTLVCTNSYPLYRGRQFGKGDLQEFHGSSGGMGIAGTKFSMPEILGDAVEAEKGVIRRPSPLFGIVTDPSHFLFAIKDKDGGIQVEDHSGGRFGF
jgi:hypothetical protein